MTFQVVYSQNAQDEIEAAYRWIAQSAPVAAGAWRDELILRVETLTKNPLAYPRATEGTKVVEDIRQLLFGKRNGQYKILYTVCGNEVVVLSLRRSRRKAMAAGDL